MKLLSYNDRVEIATRIARDLNNSRSGDHIAYANAEFPGKEVRVRFGKRLFEVSRYGKLQEI